MGVAKVLSVVIAASVLLVSADFAAARDRDRDRGFPWRVKRAAAPEIDAASGAQALGLLSGILFLVGERNRRRRKSPPPA